MLKIIKYNILCTIHSKDSVFWLLLFPIILSILFNVALRDITSDEGFETINIAVVNDENYKKSETMANIIDDVSVNDKSESKDNTLFVTKYVNMDEAKSLLKNEKISGYIYFSDNGEVNLEIKSNGMSQTILKKFLDIAEQKTDIATKAVLKNKGEIPDNLNEIVNDTKEYIVETSDSQNKPDTVVLFFYSILGMTCMYGANIGCELIAKVQSNQSAIAKRNCVAPVSKMKIFLGGFISSSITCMAIIFIVLGFIAFVLGIDFGDRYPYIVFTSIVGANTGLGIGCLIGSLSRKSLEFKSGIVIAFSMVCSFLAGMMSTNIKYLVEKNAFIVGRLNPVNLITESYYKLFYYSSLEKYFENIAILLAMMVVSIFVSVYILCRQERNKKLEGVES